MPTLCLTCGHSSPDEALSCERCARELPVREHVLAGCAVVGDAGRSSYTGADDVAPSAESLEYLLEDDPPESNDWRLYVALGLLILTSALVAWGWSSGDLLWV